MPLYGKIIVIKRTGADGYNFPLTSSSCLFGRKTECDIRIQLPHVSKEHCKLEVNENNEVILTNLSEVNRTHLNSKVVLLSERLKHRDVFTIIDRSFRFEYPSDSVHNTSPRKRRSLSSLKNETLQVLHVQQGVDDGSQPSGNARRSTSGRTSDKVDVDKIFEAPTKPAKATPNERDDSAPKHVRKRSSTKILNDEQPADEEYLSPFSKLYEMFKQEATKPIQVNPNETNMHIAVKENSTDMTKQTGVPEKESDAAISQYGQNPRASLSAKLKYGRRSKITQEECKNENNSGYEKVNHPETLLIDAIATAKSVANIKSPNKNNVSVELNKFKETFTSEAMVTSPAFSDVAVKEKELNYHLSPKCTPKTTHKSQDFTTLQSLTYGKAVKETQEIHWRSVEKDPSIVTKTIGMEQVPINVGKEKAETPKNRERSSLRNKKFEPTDIQSELGEYTNISELSTAISEVEDKSVEMEHPAANVGEEKAERPKHRGRPSVRNTNVQPTESQSEQAESLNLTELSARKSVEMDHPAANVGDEKAETPKTRGRPSLRNKKVQPTDTPSEQAESTNVTELSAGTAVEMEHTEANVGEEKAETPKQRGRPSLRNKNVQSIENLSEQAESSNFTEISATKSIEMDHTEANVGEIKAETPKTRGRPSLRNINVQPTEIQPEQAESTNVTELSARKSVEIEHPAADVGEEKAETPKTRGRPSLRNKNLQPIESPPEQAESTNVTDLSARKSVEIEHPAADVVEEKVETPGKRGRPSLRNKNVQPIESQPEQADSTNVTELSAGTAVEMEHTEANVAEEKAETSKRGRPSLRNKNVQSTENQSEQAKSSIFTQISARKSVEMDDTAANVGEIKAETPKTRGRPSLRNKNVQPTDTPSEQAESTNVTELSAKQSVEIEHPAADVGEEKAETHKTRGRPSLRNKNVHPTDTPSEQAESTNVTELSAGTAVEMEHREANVGEEKAETPGKRGRPSLRNKNVQPIESQPEQAESTNVTELSAGTAVEMEHTEANVGEEKAETPKRGRPSLRNKNVLSTENQSEQAKSSIFTEISARKSVEMDDTAANVGEIKAETPKTRGRPSLRNKNVQPTEFQPEQAESTNVTELSARKSVEIEHPAADVGEEKAETPKTRGRPSLRNKNVQPTNTPSEQAESTNVTELSAGTAVEMEHTEANVGEEKAETPKQRGRPSLRNKNVQPTEIQSEQRESTNCTELSASISVKINHTAANVGEKKAESPKKRGRPSLRNKNVQPTDIQSEQAESTHVTELSARKSEVEDKSVEMEHTDDNVGEGKAEAPKKCGRPSLSNKTVQPTDVKSESAEISEAAIKSEALSKQKSGTPVSPIRRLRKKESDAPNYSNEVECLKKKGWASKSPQRDLASQQLEKVVAGRYRKSPINTVAVQMESFSSGDVELDLSTSNKGSPAAAISHLSKKRRSEHEENFYGPSFKRKRVSFGANLSPEVFDKRMPPSSPLRKGGTPTRVSTPFRCTPRTVLKCASGIGMHTCTIQEFGELNENHPSPMRSTVPSGTSPRQTKKSPAEVPSPGKKSLTKTSIKPPAKRTPLVKMTASTKTPSMLDIKQSFDAKTPLPSKTPSKRSPCAKRPLQNKTPSSATKKSAVAKTLPNLSPRKLVANKMSSPITEGSIDCSPRVRGRFSISQIATPPHLTRSKSPHCTPSHNLVPQQKASSVKKPSRKSGSLLAAGRYRRQTGASAANLLVTKSWAQIVKEGVARPQLQCARKKSAVVQKRTKKTSSKVTPACSVKGHFSTGHAASPATIVIGRSQATTIKTPRKAPQVVRPVSLTYKDYDMDESFTGVAEMFSTPIHENENTHPILCTSSIVDESQTAVTSPVTQKSFDDSIIKTPEETGVMAISPLTTADPRSNRKYNNSVSRLLRCRANFSSSLNDLSESISQVPKVKGKPVKDVVDIKRTMKTPRIKGKPVEDMVGVKRIMKTPKIKGKPVDDMVGVKRIMKTPRVKGKPVEDMVGVKRIMKTPKVKEKPVEYFTGLCKLMAEPKPKVESPEVSYVGIKKLFQGNKEMESCDYSGLAEMFSTPVKAEESSDSKLQQASKISTNEEESDIPPALPEKIYSDGQTTENKFSQIVKQHSDELLTTNNPPQEGGNSSLTSDAQVTRKGQVRTKGVTSPSSKEESMQRPEQLKASQMFPENGHVDFSEGEITESKDGHAAVNKWISPTRRSLKERKEMKDTGAEEFPTTVNAIPNNTEEVGKLNSTRRSLTRKINDTDVKMSLMPNKTTPGKRESHHEQSEELIVLKPQARGSLKKKGNFQNAPNVELKGLPSSTVKIPTSSKNESPGRAIEEINKLVSPRIKSLRGKKKVQNVHSNKMKELFALGKTIPGRKESHIGQIDEVNEITSLKSSLECKKEAQNIPDVEVISPPISAKNCMQDEKPIPVAQIEEVVCTALRRSQRRKKETENIQVTGVKKSSTVAKSSNGKTSRYGQTEKQDNSTLKMIMQEKNNTKNVDSGLLKNGYASPTPPIKETEEVKDHPIEDEKALIRVGRPQRRKNINVEETETTNGYTRKRGARCAHIENIKESNDSQNSLTDQEEVDKTGVNSDPKESVRNGVKTENIKILEKKDLAHSKARSTRGKRGAKDLLLEEVGKDSVPAKRLRKEEELAKAPNKAVQWDPNIATPKLAECTVEALKETANKTEPSVLERTSRRGKAAKREVNTQVSVESGDVSRKAVSEHLNSKVNTDAFASHEPTEQKGRPKRTRKDISCEIKAVTKKDNGAENTNEVPPVIKLSPTPIKQSLRGNVRHKVTQVKEEHVKEMSSRNSKRITRRQKLMATTGEEPHVPVRGASGKEKHKVTTPSSKMMVKGEQAKELLVECEDLPEQTEEQQTIVTVDALLDTVSKQVLLQEDEPIVQKGKSEIWQQTKGALASLLNVDITIGELALKEKRSHLNVSIGGSEMVDDLDIQSNTGATKGSSTKSNISNAAERASEVRRGTKKTDMVSLNKYEMKENARSKRSVRKGRSSKMIATESEVENLVLDTAEKTLDLPKRASKASTRFKDTQETKSDDKKLPEPATNKLSKRKIATEDAPSGPPEGLQIEKEVVDPAKAPRKGGRGMVKRNTSAVINQELNIDVTEKEQVLSSANKAEKNKRARRGQNCFDKETAITVAQVENSELIDKRRKRANPAAQRNGDEQIQSRKDEAKVKDQKSNNLSVESSKPARRATRANKSCEIATIEPISIQPSANASICPSKITLRGKRVSAETSDPSPKKTKMEKVTGKVETVTAQGRRTTKVAVSTKKPLPVTPQPAKPTGRSTRSRK
ncbi:proliferation marker protein Ki-67-like isoform X2 [Scyliorhinus canicula]|uniref:proliferation marker protein Ki-67-like isoform X2 n=1 Tax=Scyliorhinus canicula TaxID=7830 RepID=UPI0018F29D76|nr:proliferation marker protein Ki-67-like isoform X2 [Scyliorhinus canicula]